MLIFLVDDDYEDHEIFQMALKKVDATFGLVVAESGIEAVEKFKNEPDFKPDIIFLDVNMPRMNGKDCIRELRGMPGLTKVPMILYSTHDSEREYVEAREAGASDFITKPASISDFSNALRTILTKHLNPPA